MKKISNSILLISIAVTALLCFFLYYSDKEVAIHTKLKLSQSKPQNESGLRNPSSPTASTPIPSPTLTPTPKPMTFAQMNELWGPCTVTPVFMYHHIQSEKEAKDEGQTSLTTYSDIFEKQLIYLKEKGYGSPEIGSLVNFFNGNATFPAKSVILTFDDAYEDFYSNAYPILNKYDFKSVVFVPTGLINNDDYLTWEEISILNQSKDVYFANHTWSHYGIPNDEVKTTNEIKTADIQLFEKGLNPFKIFAYPYGSSNSGSISALKTLNYNLAFTTYYGKTLCAKKNLELPRLRAGNLMPSYYGL